MVPQACFGHISNNGCLEKFIPYKTHFSSTQNQAVDKKMHIFSNHKHFSKFLGNLNLNCTYSYLLASMPKHLLNVQIGVQKDPNVTLISIGKKQQTTITQFYQKINPCKTNPILVRNHYLALGQSLWTRLKMCKKKNMALRSFRGELDTYVRVMYNKTCCYNGHHKTTMDKEIGVCSSSGRISKRFCEM